jgi:hypothetical protein
MSSRRYVLLLLFLHVLMNEMAEVDAAGGAILQMLELAG